MLEPLLQGHLRVKNLYDVVYLRLS